MSIKIELTPKECKELEQMIRFNIESIAGSMCNSYIHPDDVTSWGQDLIEYGALLKKVMPPQKKEKK